jgi:hypothetical protein
MSCSVTDCTHPAKAKGLCSIHYARWWRSGDPLGKRQTLVGEPMRYLIEVVMAYDGDECLIWPYGRSGNGYGHINRKNVHRIVCKETHGAPPTPKHEAAHSCGKGHLACVTKGHLSWKTRKENEADKALHGTQSLRGPHEIAELTPAEISEIRSLKGKTFQRSLAKQYGITRDLVSRIQNEVSEREQAA